MGKKLPRPTRRCIFCNATGVTVEHIWPKWLRRYVPPALKKHTYAGILVDRAGSERIARTWSGDPTSRGIKAVCEKCNNGWMSQLEERAKPILIRLLSGGTRVLSREDQTILASWSAMHIMVAEHFEPEKSAIPSTDHRYLWQTGLAPDTWKIWIGNYRRGKWVGYWVHHALAIDEDYVSYSSEGSIARGNTQTTTFIVGQLYIHAFSSSSMPSLSSRFNLGPLGIQKLAQIWPIRESALVWPPTVMNDLDADGMAREIFTTLNTIGNAFGR